MSSSFKANAEGRHEVTGTKGTIEAPRGIIPGHTTRVSETIVVVMDADGRRREETLPAADHSQLMIEAFGEAILSGRPAPRTPARSLGDMPVPDAIARAARSSRSGAWTS